MKQLSFLILLCLPLIALKFPKTYKKLSKEYAYVPLGEVHYHIDKEGKRILKTDTTYSFLIAKNEVTNGEYTAFINYLKKNDPMNYTKHLPDTLVWAKAAFAEVYATYYFNHPAYKDYPVVGVNKVQAQEYCKWLSTEINSKYSDIKVKARLPKKKEWIRAARGNTTWAYAKGNVLRNSDGLTLYNYLVVGDEYIHYNSDSLSFDVMTPTVWHYRGLITLTSDSYWPNQWGLYNVCGNVAEMIEDENIALGGSWNSTGYDIRVESQISNKTSMQTGFRVLLEMLE